MNKSFLSKLKEEQLDYLFYYANTLDAGLETASELGLYGLSINIQNIDEDAIKKAHAQGLKVAVFNVHTKARNKKALAIKADYIQTDMINYLRKISGR